MSDIDRFEKIKKGLQADYLNRDLFEAVVVELLRRTEYPSIIHNEGGRDGGVDAYQLGIGCKAIFIVTTVARPLGSRPERQINQ